MERDKEELLNLKEKLANVCESEKELWFRSFGNREAWELGSMLVKKAQKENLPITIDIRKNVQQLFHYANDNTSLDNDIWIERKVRLLNRSGISSYHMSLELQIKETTLERERELSTFDYAAHGGCFPIQVAGCGMIGTLTVSGLEQQEDHRIVVEAIKEYIEW